MRDDVSSFAGAWRRAWAEDARQAASRADRARSLLPELVRLLVETWSARRVLLIGSLLDGRFGMTSDIDLVVEGLDPAVFYHVCAALDRLAGEFRVDLVPLESARPFVRDLIASGRAEVLYDATTI